MKTTIITHPKCKELSGKIIERDDPMPCGQFEIETCMGYEDWFETFDEAKKDLEDDLQYEYSGKGARDRANDRAYARQEQIACGNY